MCSTAEQCSNSCCCCCCCYAELFLYTRSISEHCSGQQLHCCGCCCSSSSSSPGGCWNGSDCSTKCCSYSSFSTEHCLSSVSCMEHCSCGSLAQPHRLSSRLSLSSFSLSSTLFCLSYACLLFFLSFLVCPSFTAVLCPLLRTLTNLNMHTFIYSFFLSLSFSGSLYFSVFYVVLASFAF